MKYFFIFFFLLSSLTGCSSKEKLLNCTTTTEQDGKQVEIKLESSWKNDNLNKLKIEVIYELGTSLTSEKKDAFQNYIDSTMSSWKEKEGVKYEANLENNKLFMLLDINASKGKKALKEFGIDTEKITYDSFQAELEKDNYTCK